MSDTETDLPWADIPEGGWIRMATPAWVRRGQIVRKKGRGLKVRWIGFDRDITIPDARWYVAQYKGGNRQEYIVSIDKPRAESKVTAAKRKRIIVQDDAFDDDTLISLEAAAGKLGVDKKRVRAMLRSGKLQGVQQGGRWVGVVDPRTTRS